jgi:plasmid maintenance system antidote protein VapI
MNLKLKMKIIERFRTQADFAAVIGTHEAVISKVVNNRRRLPVEEQAKWAKKLGTTAEELFSA